MTEEGQSALKLALQGMHSSTDFFIHTLEHHLDHALGNAFVVGAEGIGTAPLTHLGIAETYAVAEVLTGTYEAIEFAKAGDWDGFTKASVGVSSAAASCVTDGILPGMFEAVFDAINAVKVANGGHGLSHEDWETGGIIHIQDRLVQHAFELLHPESITTPMLGIAGNPGEHHSIAAVYEALNSRDLAQGVYGESRLTLVLPEAADVRITMKESQSTHHVQHNTNETNRQTVHGSQSGANTSMMNLMPHGGDAGSPVHGSQSDANTSTMNLMPHGGDAGSPVHGSQSDANTSTMNLMPHGGDAGSPVHGSQSDANTSTMNLMPHGGDAGSPAVTVDTEGSNNIPGAAQTGSTEPHVTHGIVDHPTDQVTAQTHQHHNEPDYGDGHQ